MAISLGKIYICSAHSGKHLGSDLSGRSNKRCVICQRKTSEALKCPLENQVKKGNKKKDAYKNFPNHVKQFQDTASFPVIVKFGCDETAENREFHRASRHKSCYAKFSSCKLEIAKLKIKRSSDSTETCSRGKRKWLNSEVCFFCENDEELLQVSTFETDASIRTIITELNDSRLRVRIVEGDVIRIGAKYHLKCLIELTNRYRGHVRESNKDEQNIDEICVTPARLSSLQVVSKKKSILENSCLNCRSCTLYMKVAWRI